MSYKVQLEVFEGPLDLLLYLIKREELDIYHIPIARIAGQYLEYIRMMRLLNLDVAGEFLVMAATLMHIKSRSLLPVEELEEEESEEDPQAELIKQLVEYQKFKGAAEELEKREIRQEEIFMRRGDEVSDLSLEEGFLLEASLFDLINAFSNVLKTVSEEGMAEIVEDETNVNDKIREILDILTVEASLNFTKIFADIVTRMEMVATFLALLELIRLKEVKIRQAQRFGEIRVYKNSNQ